MHLHLAGPPGLHQNHFLPQGTQTHAYRTIALLQQCFPQRGYRGAPPFSWPSTPNKTALMFCRQKNVIAVHLHAELTWQYPLFSLSARNTLGLSVPLTTRPSGSGTGSPGPAYGEFVSLWWSVTWQLPTYSRKNDNLSLISSGRDLAHLSPLLLPLFLYIPPPPPSLFSSPPFLSLPPPLPPPPPPPLPFSYPVLPLSHLSPFLLLPTCSVF